MTMRKLLRLFLITACLFCPIGVLEAGPVVDISDRATFSWTWAEDLTLGYSFRVDGSLTFNALAVFDVISATPGSAGHTNAVGLTQDHQVGVWDASGTLLASTIVVPGGPTTPSVNTYGTWVYKVLDAPVTLPGGTYTIGAFYDGVSDPVMVQQSALTVSGVTYLNGNFLYDSAFGRPTGTYSPNEQQYFGPTMLSVPDGGTTLILLGSALAGLAMARRRMFRG
jgi:hypothetical protein